MSKKKSKKSAAPKKAKVVETTEADSENKLEQGNATEDKEKLKAEQADTASEEDTESDSSQDVEGKSEEDQAAEELARKQEAEKTERDAKLKAEQDAAAKKAKDALKIKRVRFQNKHKTKVLSIHGTRLRPNEVSKSMTVDQAKVLKKNFEHLFKLKWLKELKA